MKWSFLTLFNDWLCAGGLKDGPVFYFDIPLACSVIVEAVPSRLLISQMDDGGHRENGRHKAAVQGQVP